MESGNKSRMSAWRGAGPRRLRREKRAGCRQDCCGLWASRAVGDVVVGVASCRRCCCGRRELPTVLLWASRAAGGADVGVTSCWRCCCGHCELQVGLLWASRLPSRLPSGLLWASRLSTRLLSWGCRSWRWPEEEGLEAWRLLVLISLYKQPKRHRLMLLKKKFKSFEPTGSSGSLVGPPVQAVQSRFDLHPV